MSSRRCIAALLASSLLLLTIRPVHAQTPPPRETVTVAQAPQPGQAPPPGGQAPEAPPAQPPPAQPQPHVEPQPPLQPQPHLQPQGAPLPPPGYAPGVAPGAPVYGPPGYLPYPPPPGYVPVYQLSPAQRLYQSGRRMQVAGMVLTFVGIGMAGISAALFLTRDEDSFADDVAREAFGYFFAILAVGSFVPGVVLWPVGIARQEEARQLGATGYAYRGPIVPQPRTAGLSLRWRF